jgi:hypothetical protein
MLLARMVDGRSITGRLPVGSPKREIRRPIGSGRLEVRLKPIPSCSDKFNIGFRTGVKDLEPDTKTSSSDLG